jgi:fructokinase
MVRRCLPRRESAFGFARAVRCTRRPGNIPHDGANVNRTRFGVRRRKAKAPLVVTQEMTAHTSRFETLVDAIRRYLAMHPASSDTVEGIAGWVVSAVASATADEVRGALSHLEARGEVAVRHAAGGEPVYARTDAMPATASTAGPPQGGTDTLRIGIDLGGTKTEIVALDAEGRERVRRREPTPRDDYEAIISLVAQLVRDTEDACGAPAGSARVGIGTPGSLSPATGLLRGSNSVCMNGMPVKRDLETRLARAVALANDANCFTLSEATDGAGRGGDVVFGVILGTGVGGGLTIHGRLLEGRNAIAGEWGHNPLPWPRDDERPGPACFCGQTGCIETWLSGPGLVRDYRNHGGTACDSTHAIVAGADRHDAQCEATLVRYEERLARALAHVVNIVDPDVIVLGGGLSNVARWYHAVPALWTRWIFSDRVDTKLARHVHGDSSGVRGAAWLAR